MHRIDHRKGRRAAARLAGLMVLASTGTAHAQGFGLLSGGTPAVPAQAPARATAQSPACPPQGYVAYRPVLSRLMQPKQLYLSNYAGVYYPSRAPGAPLTPTTFRAITSSRHRPLFGNP